MDKGIIIVSVLFTFLLTLFGAGHAVADLYKWVGEDGIVHITDDMGKVPEELRAGVKVYKTKKVEKRIEGPRRVHIPETVVEKKTREALYGDHPLEWWEDEFSKINKEMDDLSAAIERKKRYISVFEGGRRLGQTFGTNEADTYHRFKKEVLQDEKTLEGLTDDLKELKRKAAIHGVPRGVRGE
ncbi:MAG: DUF4124 domain-containing protein [Thermodesulfobacteriota bacterium]